MPDTSQFDLFISYSRRDKRQSRVSDFVALLRDGYRALTNGDELRVFFDTDDIKGMDDWEHHILDGIRSTRLLLVFLSPNYLESEYCHWEFNEYLKHEVARALLGEGIAPICFVEIPGWNSREFGKRAEWVAELNRRQHFDFRPWFDEGAAALKDVNVKVRLDDLNGQIRDRLDRISRVIDAKGNVDRHNEHFVGRRVELRRLREMVGIGKAGVLTTIHGLGGIGKTALATEYAYNYAHKYPAGRWRVACENQTDLRLALITLAGVRDLEFEFTDEEKRRSATSTSMRRSSTSSRSITQKAKGPFVVASRNPPRPKGYGCQRDIEALLTWLRVHGVKSRKPLHDLRKEFGSLLIDQHGIFVASRMLRHSSVAITKMHYADKRNRASVGLGHLLNESSIAESAAEKEVVS